MKDFDERWEKLINTYIKHPHCFVSGCGRRTFAVWANHANKENKTPSYYRQALDEAESRGLLVRTEGRTGHTIYKFVEDDPLVKREKKLRSYGPFNEKEYPEQIRNIENEYHYCNICKTWFETGLRGENVLNLGWVCFDCLDDWKYPQAKKDIQAKITKVKTIQGLLRHDITPERIAELFEEPVYKINALINMYPDELPMETPEEIGRLIGYYAWY